MRCRARSVATYDLAISLIRQAGRLSVVPQIAAYMIYSARPTSARVRPEPLRPGGARSPGPSTDGLARVAKETGTW